MHYARLGKMAVGQVRFEQGMAALRVAHDILSVTLPTSNRGLLEAVEEFQALAAAGQSNDMQRFARLLMAMDPSYTPGGAPPVLTY